MRWSATCARNDGILFNGDENKATESIILSKTGVKNLGRIGNEPYFDKNVIAEYADVFRDALEKL